MHNKYVKHLKSKRLPIILVVLILLFSFVSISGLSTITGNKNPSVGTMRASAQEPAGINSDNKVDVFDLSVLLIEWIG